jgi:hypothetical protein
MSMLSKISIAAAIGLIAILAVPGASIAQQPKKNPDFQSGGENYKGKKKKTEQADFQSGGENYKGKKHHHHHHAAPVKDATAN